MSGEFEGGGKNGCVCIGLWLIGMFDGGGVGGLGM